MIAIFNVFYQFSSGKKYDDFIYKVSARENPSFMRIRQLFLLLMGN